MASLSILTLNMQNGQIWDEHYPDQAPIDLEQTIELLRGNPSDVYLLQEVEFPLNGNPPRNHHPNYDKLRKALGSYYSCFTYPAATRKHLPFGIGLSIFSRYRLENHFHAILPASNVEFEFRGETWLPAERSLLGAELCDAEGKRWSLLNTHLQAYFMIGSSSDAHPGQRRIVQAILKGRKLPTILGGDFNCAESEGTLSDFESTGMTTVQKDIITWYRKPMVIDHLMYSPDLRVESWKVIDTQASDHKAVQAVFSF